MREHTEGGTHVDLADEAEQLEGEVMALARRAREVIEEIVVERPHAALAAGAAIGFVLGGGLTPKRVVRVATAIAGPLVTRTLVAEGAKFLRSYAAAAPACDAEVGQGGPSPTSD